MDVSFDDRVLTSPARGALAFAVFNIHYTEAKNYKD